MKRISCLLILILAFTAVTNAQDRLPEVYTREHIPQKKFVPYPYVREADVMWSKVVYRMVDLRQKQNLPLYYPTEPIGDRRSLINLVLHGIDNEGIRAFSADDPLNEFNAQMTIDEIDEAFGAGIDTVPMTDPLTGQISNQIVQRERRTDEVKKLLLKEKWFFDKNHSVMKVRIVGICPIRTFYRNDPSTGMPILDDPQNKKTFWVYFPEIRPLLASSEIYNQFNDAQNISFDDYFEQRRFASFIYQVSNVYDNRRIGAYATGVDALLEAEQLKTWLFNIEHDLWEY